MTFALMFLFLCAVINSLPAKWLRLVQQHILLTKFYVFSFTLHYASSFSSRSISLIGESVKFYCNRHVR